MRILAGLLNKTATVPAKPSDPNKPRPAGGYAWEDKHAAKAPTPEPAPEPLRAASTPLPPVDYAARLEAAVGADFGPVLAPDAQEPLTAQKTEDQPVENLALGKAATKALVRAGFETIGDLRAFDGEWTQFAGIGAKGAESIVTALEGYQDAPAEDPAPAEDRKPFRCIECGSSDFWHPVTGEMTRVYDDSDTAPSVTQAFDGLILASADLELGGLSSWKVVDGTQLFDDQNDATVIAGLRVFAEYKRIVITFPDHSDYIRAAVAFADKYGIPCFTNLPF